MQTGPSAAENCRGVSLVPSGEKTCISREMKARCSQKLAPMRNPQAKAPDWKYRKSAQPSMTEQE